EGANSNGSLHPHPDSLPKGKGDVGLAWVELSTGRFHSAVFPREKLADQLARIGPAECLLEEASDTAADLKSGIAADLAIRKTLVTRRPAWAFSLAGATAALAKQFETATLEGFGFDAKRDALALRAAGAILEYLTETQRASLAHLDRLLPYQTG